MTVWSGERIAKFVKQPPEIKINPNGVDLKVSEVWRINDDSNVIINFKQREIIPPKVLIKLEGEFYTLKRGIYEIRVANEIEIPKNVVAFFFPRSTLNRLGIIKSQTAVGDSGYKGFATQTIFVPIKKIKIHKDEFWIQLVYMDCESSNLSYDGHWQNEKPKQ